MNPFYYEYADELPSSYVQEVYPEDVVATKPGWVKWLVIVGLLTTSVAIFIGVRPEHLVGVSLAFLNCLIVGTAIVKLANKRSLCSILVITFLLWPTIGWCLGTIYFAIFTPDIELLNGSVRLQTVILTFLILYLTTIFYILRNEKPYTHIAEPIGRRLNSVTLLFLLFTFGFFAVTRILQLPGGGIAGTLFFYSFYVPLVAGIQATYMRHRDKLFLIVLFGLMVFFFTLANRRRYAITPIFSFLLGYFFLSRARSRTKLLFVLILLLGFPTYMIIGNTVRYFVGKAGYEDFGRSMHALKGWRYAAKEAEWADAVFTRLFFSGGHAIITETPERIPYVGFSPAGYLKETAIAFIPGKLFSRMEFEVNAKYAGNFVLNNYGISKFYITREHQVGVTSLGHFWLLGGWPFLIAGSLILALLHGLVFKIINTILTRKPEMALFLTACMLQSAIEMSGIDLINIMRFLFWRMVLAIVFYYVFIAPFLKRRGTALIEETA
ncbi:MAG: hypothetical protein AMJ43_07715 [Coxiella sp. DG_40]|nr:MAG: hypothetical protein AMJ43_07715 [Coxiella sp. DG_40]